MKIIIINGPNLNLLGKREPSVYGNVSFESYLEKLNKHYNNKVNLEYFQSNIEGEIINKIQETGFSYDGIILNAGGYSHTSIAIADAIAAVTTPVVEVHISNIYAREEARHHTLIQKNCRGSVSGFGLKGYFLAVESFVNQSVDL